MNIYNLIAKGYEDAVWYSVLLACLELRTESTLSAVGTVLFSDETMRRYLPNWVGRIKLISISVSSPI
jgi:hypothetical protein